MDPVHGGIGVLQHEISCIDHPLFQRLRFIFQNDVAHYVFPGATQNRFTHSIGVMHIAGRFFRSLIEQYIAESSNEFELTKTHREAIYYIYCCFRLAALLHDTGHFPFSHEFQLSKELESLLKSKELLTDFWAASSLYNKYAKDRISNMNFTIDHADYSLACAYKILEEKKDTIPVNRDDVLCLMENNSTQFSKQWEGACFMLSEVLEGRKGSLLHLSRSDIAKKIQYFLARMISGEVDVDKMDYLLRDSYFSGTKYGIYNLDHLLSTLRIGYNRDTEWVGLAILEKGIVALEDFIYSRFQIYQNVWSHKAVVSAKIRLAHAISEIMECPETKSYVKKALTDINTFTYFTDHFFLQKFRDYASKAPNSSSAALLSRQKFKFLMQLKDPSSDRIKETKIQLEKERGNNDEIIPKEVKIKFSKIPDRDFSDIKILSIRPDGKRELSPMSDKSDFFEKFTEKLICNFYVKPKHISG